MSPGPSGTPAGVGPSPDASESRAPSVSPSLRASVQPGETRGRWSPVHRGGFKQAEVPRVDLERCGPSEEEEEPGWEEGHEGEGEEWGERGE